MAPARSAKASGKAEQADAHTGQQHEQHAIATYAIGKRASHGTQEAAEENDEGGEVAGLHFGQRQGDTSSGKCLFRRRHSRRVRRGMIVPPILDIHDLDLDARRRAPGPRPTARSTAPNR
jgi:hypothetical protein